MVKKLENRTAGTQLIVFLVSKVGVRDALKVCTFIVQWGTVARKLHREPTWPEYCAYWKESRATWFRALAVYRKVWPNDKNPQRVWRWCEDRLPARLSVPDAVNRLSLLVMA